MGKGMEELKKIGVQKIYEKTHIPAKHIKSLFEDDFESLNKVQFLGFISILEREYNLKLVDVRERGLEYFKKTVQDEHLESKLFITTQKKDKHLNLYLLFVLLVLIGIVFYIFSKPSDIKIQKQKIDIAVTNTEDNVSLKIKKQTIIKETPKVLKIMPQKELWLGYMDLDTGEKKQKLFKGELDLDPDKRWLLSLGHGDVSFEIGDSLKVFHSEKNMKFVYEDFQLKEIGFKEFKRLNKGIQW